MRSLDFWSTVGGIAGVAVTLGCLAGSAAKRVGTEVGNLAAKVNPDVWHELSYTSLAAYSLLLPKRERIFDRGQDDFPPVILVHGMGSNRGTWWPFRLFLMVNGHRRVYAFGYEDGTVEQHAEDLKSFVNQVQEVTGEARVDIVAHSLGGVIARYTIQRLELAGSVRTLVTLASPHRGTYAARYANTRLTRALCPESALLRDLNEDDLSRLEIRFVTLHSNRDVMVMPREAMTHPNAENLFVPDLSHTELIFSPKVFRIVSSYLTPVRFHKLLMEPV